MLEGDVVRYMGLVQQGNGDLRKPELLERGGRCLCSTWENVSTWVCDIGKKNKLRQTTLLFKKTTFDNEDNPNGEVGTPSTLRARIPSTLNASVGQGEHSVHGLELI